MSAIVKVCPTPAHGAFARADRPAVEARHPTNLIDQDEQEYLMEMSDKELTEKIVACAYTVRRKCRTYKEPVNPGKSC